MNPNHHRDSAPVRVPQAGQVLRIDETASVQFGGSRALTLRVTKICDRPTYHGWVWITGYVLDHNGNAVEKREIFVRRAGLKLLTPTVPPPRVLRSRNRGPS